MRMTYRTENRIQEIRRRTRIYRKRREKRTFSLLTMCSLFLLCGIGGLLNTVQPPGVSTVTDGYGALLLRQGAEGYIVVGVAAFAVGTALTILCIRYRERASARSKSENETEN